MLLSTIKIYIYGQEIFRFFLSVPFKKFNMNKQSTIRLTTYYNHRHIMSYHHNQTSKQLSNIQLVFITHHVQKKIIYEKGIFYSTTSNTLNTKNRTFNNIKYRLSDICIVTLIIIHILT